MPCVGVGTAAAGMPGRALGCLFLLQREQHPKLQAGTGGHWPGMAGKALNSQEVHCCCSICDMVAPSGKSYFLGTFFTSPGCPACLPREAKLWGTKQRGPCKDPHSTFCKVFPFSTSPNLPGTVTKESREQGAGTEVLSKMPSLCVHPLNHTYICIYMKSLVLNIDVISV